jgi:hypothetical protein
MVLQQIGDLDNENVSQQPTTVIKRVKKKNPKIVLEDSVSDSSSDSLPIKPVISVEDVPIQRPKRSKIQRQQKSSR